MIFINRNCDRTLVRHFNIILPLQMPLSNKEKAARYWERINADPIKKEAILAKRRERYSLLICYYL